MDLSLALREVLDYLETGANPAFLNYDIVSEWDAGVLAALLNAGLIAVAPKVASLECRGCEERCFMDVTFAEGKSRAYVVCDVPHKQAEMGRIAVPLERLQQWQCSPQLLANAIVSLLGLSGSPQPLQESGVFRLGMMEGAKGRRLVTLHSAPSVLEINGQHVPVAELLYAKGDQIAVDLLQIQQLLKRDRSNGEKPYRPSADRREMRKLASQSMYQDWQNAYRDLLKKKPNRTKVWYSRQIAGSPVAQGRDAETIRKQLR